MTHGHRHEMPSIEVDLPGPDARPVLGGFQGPPRPAGLVAASTLGTAIVGGGRRLPARPLARATSSPAATPTSPTAARTTSPSSSGFSSASSAGSLGIGALNYPLAKIVGRGAPSRRTRRPAGPGTSATPSTTRWSASSTSIGVLIFFFTGGLLAMAIRTELLNPTSHVFGPGTYIAIVSEHGTIMMMMADLGHRRPARQLARPADDRVPAHGLPRVEAFSFWIFSAGYLVILTRPAARRLPHRLDRLRPAADPGAGWDGRPTWWASPSSGSA